MGLWGCSGVGVARLPHSWAGQGQHSGKGSGADTVAPSIQLSICLSGLSLLGCPSFPKPPCRELVGSQDQVIPHSVPQATLANPFSYSTNS